MKRLSPAKIHKTLATGLETLHLQSRQWLEKISFWQDEYDALYILMIHLPNISNRYRLAIETKEKELFEKILNNELKDLRLSVIAHERSLSQMIKVNLLDEELYQSKHKMLSSKITAFEQKYLLFKKEIFQIIKLVRKDSSTNEVLKTIFDRRAVRKYKTKQVPVSLIEKLLEAGKMAPSAMNQQPWKFYIITNKETITTLSRAISKIVSKQFFKVGIKKIVKSIKSFTLAHSINFLKEKDPVFHSAPVVLFITAPKGNEWAPIDIGMCAQNIMLAAKSLGLDSCPVGFGKFVMQTPEYSCLKISPSEEVILALILGYGDETPVASDRNTKTTFYL